MAPTPLHRLETLSGALADRVTLATGVLVLLIALLALAGIWQTQSVRADLDAITGERVRKLQLITDLMEAAYNRHVALVNLTLIEDPFERDDQTMLFHRHGYAVGKARNDFRALPLDDFERANFAEQDALIRDILTLQEQALERAEAHDLDGARKLLANPLRDLDGRYDRVIEALRQYEARAIATAAAHAEARARDAVVENIVLAALGVGLAIAISLSMRRRLRQRARQIAQQIDALRLSDERLRHEASHDPLTRLANRALFMRRLEEAIARARDEGREIALLYLDMDHFKPVNDTYGHGVGDQLLQVVAQRLSTSVRQHDTVARLGGDEFAILLDPLGENDDLARVRDLLLGRLTSPVSLAGNLLHPRGSLGMAVYPRDGDAPDQLLAAADQAMFEIKRLRQAAETEART